MEGKYAMMGKSLTSEEREKKRILKEEKAREQAKKELLAMNNIKTHEVPKEKKKKSRKKMRISQGLS